MYTYRAKVVDVYDGDTCKVDIDLGFGVILAKQSVRLLGINCLEMKGQGKDKGKDARDFVRSKILGKNIIIKTFKDKKEKYGRWLANIFYDERGDVITASVSISELKCLNEEIVASGHAVVMEY